MLKKTILILLASTAGFAAEDKCELSYWDYHPLHVAGNAIRLGTAEVTGSDQSGNLIFGKYNAYVDLLVPVSKKNYFFPRIEFNSLTLNWDKNPKFTETEFNYTQYSLTFLTVEIEKWRWIMRAQYNLDNKHYSDPKEYGLFSALLWGANDLFDKWHYHIGALGYSGLEGGQYYPIIGVDYSPNDKWTFLAIFPIDYFIQYKFNDRWSVALKGRPLKERFRVSEDQPQPKSIFSYSSTGAELNFHYEIKSRLELDAYAGWNFGGEFYIKDQNGNNGLYTTTESSAYGGGAVNFAF